MHLFVCGYPSDIGGANTELWHTVKLWRRFGVDVTLIPTWKADATWRARLDAIGCRTCETNPDDLENVPGLARRVVVSMCNTRFLAVAERFRRPRLPDRLARLHELAVSRRATPLSPLRHIRSASS